MSPHQSQGDAPSTAIVHLGQLLMHAGRLTPWNYAKPVGAVLVAMVLAIYVFLADFSVL